VFTAIGTALGLTGAAATIGGAAILGGAAYGAASAIDKPKMPDMPQLPQAPKMQDAEDRAAAIAKEKRKQIAASQTVYTSPLGVADEAETARKTLLGR